MPPADCKKARAVNALVLEWVDDRPYLPELRVVHCDDDDAYSVKATTAHIMLLNQQQYRENGSLPECRQVEAIARKLSVERITGGITNVLYKVSGLLPHAVSTVDSVLLRVFGAEGMIDRDDENAVYASLSMSKIAPPYFGRFANGRVEGWMDGMRPLETGELSYAPIARGIAASLATLHFGFAIPAKLRTEPSLWTQLHDWLDQAEKASFRNDEETAAAASLQLSAKIRPELSWLRDQVATVIGDKDDAIVFCHNDLLAANILYDDDAEIIQLIDFEYGGVNYRAFDIANHFNEYAGGPPDHSAPDYSLLPDSCQQRAFIRAYLETAATIRASAAETQQQASENNNNGDTRPRHQQIAVPVVTEEQVDMMIAEVEIFLLANHFYWGLWAVNQAATQGCAAYDYMTYAVNRIQRYWITKLEQGHQGD